MPEKNSINLKEKFDLSDEYLKIATNADKNNENFNIVNSTINHAKFLIYLLIKRAKKEIKIYSGNLHSECYGDILIKKAVKEALEKNVKISILVNKSNTQNKFLGIDIVNVKKDKSLPLDNHFLVVDDYSYRMEAKHAKSVKDVKAQVNFNEPRISKGLSVFFDKIYSASV